MSVLEPAGPPGPDRAGVPRGHPLLRSLALVAGLAVAGSAATGEHTVRQGETLSEIAVRHGVSTSELARANGIADLHRVVAGRTLTIPGTASGSAPAAASHTVALGETLSHVAVRHGISVAALARANGIADEHRVVAGRTLTIPSGSAPGGVAAATGTYTIQPGDTLSGIAARTGVPMAALAGANGLSNRNWLIAGRTLQLPAAATGAPAAVRAGSGPRGLPLRLRQSPDRLAYIPSFERWAAHYGVPADLLMAMTWLESGWQNHVVSPVGAVGIGQLMPDTVTWMRDVLIREPLDPGDPDDNIRMSARYLRWLLDRFGGDARLALGGYYQGAAAVEARGLYADTERYASNILAFRDNYF